MDEAIRQLMMQMQMRRMMEGMLGNEPRPSAGAPPDTVQFWPPKSDWITQAPQQDPGIYAGQVYGGMQPPAGYARRRDEPVGDVVLPTPQDPWRRGLDPMAYGRSSPDTMDDRRLQLLRASDTFLQRPPLAPGVGAASAPQAWFENPPWLQGEPPESYGRIMGPYPGPSGLSGDYSRGKLFGPQSPLRGTVRQSFQF